MSRFHHKHVTCLHELRMCAASVDRLFRITDKRFYRKHFQYTTRSLIIINSGTLIHVCCLNAFLTLLASAAVK